MSNRIILLTLLIISGFYRSAFPINLDLSLVPENPSILILFAGKKELAETVVSQISDGDVEDSLKDLLNYRDQTRFAVGFIDLSTWDYTDTELDDEISDHSIIFLPIKLGQSDLLSVLEEDFDVEIADEGTPIYELNESVFAVFSQAKDGDYIVISTEQQQLEDYLNSRRLKTSQSGNADQLKKFIKENEENVFAIYVGSDIIRTAEQIVYTYEGMTNLSKSEEILSRYNFYSQIDYAELSISSLELPIYSRLKVHLLDDRVINQVMNFGETIGGDYLETNQSVFVEINMAPEILMRLLNLVDFFEDWELDDSQLERIREVLSGSIMATVYTRPGFFRPSIYSRFPYFLAVIGVKDSIEVGTLITEWFDYEVMRIGANIVQKIETDNKRVPELYFFLNQDDLVIANDETYLSDYVDRWNNWDVIFEKDYSLSENEEPVFIFDLLQSEMVNELIYRYIDDFWIQFEDFELTITHNPEIGLLELNVSIR